MEPQARDKSIRRPVRVLYIARAPFVSGAERALESMLRHADRTQIQPAVVLGHESELVQRLEAMDVPVVVAALAQRSKWTLPQWWRSLRQVGRAIRDFEPDVLHANDIPSAQAMSVLGAQRRIPRIAHVRWAVSATQANWWLPAGAECLMLISRWVKEQLGSVAGTRLESAALEVLPDSVEWDEEANRAGEERRGDQGPSPDRQIAGSPNDSSPPPLILGFAGQLIEAKGLDLVIQAMGKLAQAGGVREFELLVAGRDPQTGGQYQTHLRNLAQQCGVADRMQWLGFLEHVDDLYRRVTAMVCPSRVEPLGLVPLEASRFCVPTLASRVGGFCETIEDGVTGMLVEPTIEGWTTALSHLRQISTSQVAAMGSAAHQRTRTHYAPPVYQQRLLAIYRALAPSKGTADDSADRPARPH